MLERAVLIAEYTDCDSTRAVLLGDTRSVLSLKAAVPRESWSTSLFVSLAVLGIFSSISSISDSVVSILSSTSSIAS